VSNIRIHIKAYVRLLLCAILLKHSSGISLVMCDLRGCIQKFPNWVDNEIYTYLWYYLLTSNTENYSGKTR
jgi:hypothetical protein